MKGIKCKILSFIMALTVAVSVTSLTAAARFDRSGICNEGEPSLGSTAARSADGVITPRAVSAGASSVEQSRSTLTHTVVRGDTMWKIAVRYKVGLSEIKAANTHIANPDLIYPGQVLYIPSLDSAVLAFEAEVVRLVNEIRRERGLKELKHNWELSRVARYKSQDMRDRGYFAHNSPTYGTPFEMMRSFGILYRSAGENIARGYTTPEAVVNGWMGSSGHRANILSSTFTEIGVGYVGSGHYWTQMFIFK